MTDKQFETAAILAIRLLDARDLLVHEYGAYFDYTHGVHVKRSVDKLSPPLRKVYDALEEAIDFMLDPSGSGVEHLLKSC